MSDVANKSIGEEVLVATDRKKSVTEQNEDIGETDETWNSSLNSSKSVEFKKCNIYRLP